MSIKDIFAEREHGFEEEYFLRKERELIERMHQKLSDESARAQMEEATGIHDAEVIEALQELGYTPETVQLLHLVPLIQVAWASGEVTAQERELIMQLAYARGVQPESKAQAQLSDWLSNQPAPECFENTLRAIRIFIAALPQAQQNDARQDLLSFSMRIAEASGGFLGFGSVSADERRALQQIANALTKNNGEAVEQVLAE
jgi:tellurite resistance protein